MSALFCLKRLTSLLGAGIVVTLAVQAAGCQYLNYDDYRKTTFKIFVDYSQIPEATRALIQSITITASGDPSGVIGSIGNDNGSGSDTEDDNTQTFPVTPGSTSTTIDTTIGPIMEDGTLYLVAAAQGVMNGATYTIASQESQPLSVTTEEGPNRLVNFTLTIQPSPNGCNVIQSQTPLFSGLNMGAFSLAKLADRSGVVVAYNPIISTAPDPTDPNTIVTTANTLMIAKLDNLGNVTAGPWQIDSTSASGSPVLDNPKLVATSNGYALAWQRVYPLATGASVKAVDIGLQSLNADGSPVSQPITTFSAGTPSDARPALASMADGSLYLGYQSQLNAANPPHVVVTQLDGATLAPTGTTLDLSAALSENTDSSDYISLAPLGSTLQATWSTQPSPVVPFQLRTASLSESLSVQASSTSLLPNTTTTAQLVRSTANAAGTDALVAFEATPLNSEDESIWLAEASSSSSIDKVGANIVDPNETSSADWPNLGVGPQVNVVTFYQFTGNTPGPQIMLARFDSSGARIGTADLQVSEDITGTWGTRYPDIAYLNASGGQEQFVLLWRSQTTNDQGKVTTSQLMYARVSCPENTPSSPVVHGPLSAFPVKKAGK